MDISYQAYDDALASLYDADSATGGLGAFLLKLESMIGADMASIVAYDEFGVRVSHGVCTKHHAISSDRVATWQRDAAMRRLAHHNFRRPVRLSELAPYGDLESEAWYQAQFLSFGLRHCVFQDVEIGASKIRMVAQRRAGRPEFGRGEAELFARLGKHVRVAAPRLAAAGFAGALGSDEVQVFDLNDRLRPGAHSARSMSMPAILSQRYDLTPAEVRVACAFARGEQVRAAAASLGLSVNTVKVHLRHIYEKLDLRRLPELVSLLASLQG
jgi:DNA-binding CsgD family transcriptional regulator